MTRVKLLPTAIVGIVLLVGCGGGGGTGTTSSASPSGKTATSAGGGGSGCPEATQAEATAALGKPVQRGTPEGTGKCFFAAADTRTSPATEYVSVTVTRYSSGDDARALFDAASGISTAPVTGLGDAAVFSKAADGGTVIVLRGSVTVQVDVHSTAQADPQGALKTLATTVLGRT